VCNCTTQRLEDLYIFIHRVVSWSGARTNSYQMVPGVFPRNDAVWA